jgi:hypothetical protein
VPKPNHQIPRSERPEPEAPVATALLALARLMGQAAAQEHLAASKHDRDTRDDEQDPHAAQADR